MIEKKGRESNFKEYWKKFWFLFWKDDSLKGWIFSLVLIFVLIKFIIFPTLNFFTGTNIPLAIVESCSMHHNGVFLHNFNLWWDKHKDKYQEYGITKEGFVNFPFKNGFSKGDILFIVKPNPKDVKIGDVIIFNANKKYPIIHRVINIKEENGKLVFSTIGDNNWGQFEFEEAISEDQIIGKAIFKVAPYLGWGKLIFFEPFKPSQERGFCKEN